MSNKCDPARQSEKCVLPCSLGSGHCDPWNRWLVFPPAFFPRFMFDFSVTGRAAQRLFAYSFLWSFWHYVHSADPSYAQLQLLKQHFHDWGAQKPSSTKDWERVDSCLPALLERGAVLTEAWTYCVYFPFHFHHLIAPSFLVFLCKMQEFSGLERSLHPEMKTFFMAYFWNCNHVTHSQWKYLQIQSVHTNRANTLHS